MQRFGSVVGIDEDKIENYTTLHTNTWPEVLRRIAESNIHNYSIYLRRFPDGKHYLFSYFEYTGEDFEADCALIAADPKTQEWWKVCTPGLRPFDGVPEGAWWAPMEEVFHSD